MTARRTVVAIMAATTALVVTAALSLLGVHRATTPADSGPIDGPINGPYARLLAESVNLGPVDSQPVQLTAALYRSTEPVLLTGWAHDHGLSVRWRRGDDWAVLEGSSSAVASALRVSVRQYRIRQGADSGQEFYASPQQPGVPSQIRDEVSGMGRILSYTPMREHRPVLPLDVPDGGLTPSQLLRAYNATPLADEGFTGQGKTVLVFAFDGFLQQDMDTFADTFGLPRFVPEVVGGMPERRRGEANMDLQVIHGVAPDAKLVLVNARSTVSNDSGGGAFEKLGRLMESMDDRFPGAVWSFSIGWGCDRLFTAADFTPVRAALRKAMRNGTTAFNATGDLAGLECKGGQRWSSPPSPDDVGVDAVASLPEMVAVGGTKLSTDSRGDWLDEQAWYNVPLTQGTAGGASTLFERPPWQQVGLGSELPDRRLVPDISAVSDPFTGVRIVFEQQQTVGGGTSQAAPILAGLATLMDQKLAASGAEPLGDVNPVLYRVARSQKLPAFRDINHGGNAVDQSGTSGYDMATGLGSPNIENLVKSILLVQAGA